MVDTFISVEGCEQYLFTFLLSSSSGFMSTKEEKKMETQTNQMADKLLGDVSFLRQTDQNQHPNKQPTENHNSRSFVAQPSLTHCRCTKLNLIAFILLVPSHHWSEQIIRGKTVIPFVWRQTTGPLTTSCGVSAVVETRNKSLSQHWWGKLDSSNALAMNGGTALIAFGFRIEQHVGIFSFLHSVIWAVTREIDVCELTDCASYQHFTQSREKRIAHPQSTPHKQWPRRHNVWCTSLYRKCHATER